MSDRISAVIKIQSLVRGWLCRNRMNRKSRCLEFRLKNILSNRKPPVYRKKSKSRRQNLLEKKIIMIQKHIRGFLQRKYYREMLFDKMLKEQEEHFKKRMETIEAEIIKQIETPKTSNTLISKSPKPENLYLELPLPMSQKKSKKEKSHGFRKSVVYEYDYYILAAIEIQRNFRGYISRKYFGNFKVIRRKVIKIQRIYKNWIVKKQGQLELAATLMNKQCSMLANSFSSYQHLKSLILTQDKQGKYMKFIRHCEERLQDSGVNSSGTINKYLEERIKELEQEKYEQETNFKEIMANTKNKYKGIISDYLKGLKALKFGMEISQKSNYEQITKMVRGLAEASRDIESESFYENSTFLPDVSFIDKSINIL